MEAKQLVKNLGALIPSRSFSVSTEEWYCKDLPAGRRMYTRYCLCILPGFDGSECQTIHGVDVTALMEKVSESFGEFCGIAGVRDQEESTVTMPVNSDDYEKIRKELESLDNA